MGQKFIIGNWKSNKTESEAKAWIDTFAIKFGKKRVPKEFNIILCVPFTLLSFLHGEIQKRTLPLSLGAQDVSPFGSGAYTGEITARMVKEFASYVLIGHSERRRYFQEKEEEMRFEVLQAKEAGLVSIFCVEHEHVHIPDIADIIAYEPPSAIGKGKAQSRDTAGNICKTIKQTTKKPVLYGGSVTSGNARMFMEHEGIDGVLVGGASLDADTFVQLIFSACFP